VQPKRTPLLGEILTLEPGTLLLARRSFCLEEDSFLNDHAIGQRISRLDPALRGLPIMPLTMSMEILAEAASLLMPDQRLVEMRDVRTYRWIAFENEPVTLSIEARRTADHEIYAQVREAESQGLPIVEAKVLFAQHAPQPPLAAPFTLQDERASHWKAEDIYRTGMFHGPAFQGVVSMDRVGSDGAAATVAIKQPDQLFRGDRAPSLVTDPVLLDQPGQVVGLWTAELLEQGYIIFPYYLKSLHLYDAQFEGELQCRARIELLGEERVRSDLDVVDTQGKVLMQLMSWEDRRFYLPEIFSQFIHDQHKIVLSQPWRPATATVPEGCYVYRLGLTDFDQDFFTAHGGIWQKVLAYLILSRKARAVWHALRTPPRRRMEWLLGRMAGKDAVRQLLHQHYGLEVLPADVEILPDAEGRPLVGGGWLAQIAQPPHLSLSHSEGMAIAAAAPGERCAGIGIDIEPLSRIDESTAQLAFTAQERALLASLPENQWPMRFWCAKEAVAKATSSILNRGTHGFAVQAAELEDGILQVSRVDPPVDLQGIGEPFVGFTYRHDEWVVALSLIAR
jgi:phosphopantetheinyl transferase